MGDGQRDTLFAFRRDGGNCDGSNYYASNAVDKDGDRGGLAGEDRSAHVVKDRRDETVSAKRGLLATRDTTHGSPKEDHENYRVGPPHRPRGYYCKEEDRLHPH